MFFLHEINRPEWGAGFGLQHPVSKIRSPAGNTHGGLRGLTGDSAAQCKLVTGHQEVEGTAGRAKGQSVWTALVYTAKMSGKMCNKHTSNHPTTFFGSALLKQTPRGILM